MFKRFIIGLVIFIATFTITMPVALAQNYGLETTAGVAGFKDSSYKSPEGIVAKIIIMALGATAILFFGLTLYAGFRLLTARGVEEHVTKATDTLEAAIIGLIIVAASYAISTFVINKLGG